MRSKRHWIPGHYWCQKKHVWNEEMRKASIWLRTQLHARPFKCFSIGVFVMALNRYFIILNPPFHKSVTAHNVSRQTGPPPPIMSLSCCHSVGKCGDLTVHSISVSRNKGAMKSIRTSEGIPSVLSCRRSLRVFALTGEAVWLIPVLHALKVFLRPPSFLSQSAAKLRPHEPLRCNAH